MSPKTAPSKWAVGEPMIEWCARNGLDANRIIDKPDAFQTTKDGDLLVWQVYEQDEEWPDGPRRFVPDEPVQVQLVVTPDEPPPLNPEWVALFGEP